MNPLQNTLTRLYAASLDGTPDEVTRLADEALALAHPSRGVVDEADLLGAIARGWCAPENASKEMDADLATAIMREVQALPAALPAVPDAPEWLAVMDALDVVNDAANDCRHRGDYDKANKLVKARVALYRAAIESYYPATPAAQPAVPDGCQWSGDEMGLWESACGILYQFTDGGPAENKHTYCHGCGKPLVLAATPAHDQPEGEG